MEFSHGSRSGPVASSWPTVLITRSHPPASNRTESACKSGRRALARSRLSTRWAYPTRCIAKSRAAVESAHTVGKRDWPQPSGAIDGLKWSRLCLQSGRIDRPKGTLVHAASHVPTTWTAGTPTARSGRICTSIRSTPTCAAGPTLAASSAPRRRPGRSTSRPR
jgi:hypothetical protein